MKFKVAREALLKPLQVVGGVIEKRQTLPVLSNVLVTVRGGEITLTGSDLEVELKARARIEEGDDLETTLPGRKFLDICRMLPDDAELTISVEGDKATVRSGKSRYTLATLPAEEFPATESIAGAFVIDLEESLLKGLIEKTQFCMANQDVRYYLNGMLLEIGEGKIRTVATDGHRLAVSETACEQAQGEKRQVIVPRKGVLELSRLLSDQEDKIKIGITGNHIKVELGDTTFTSKLVDGRFPDYERVVPRGGDKLVVADRAALGQALVRTSILSNEKYRGIRLNFSKGWLKATVNNPEQEEAEEELEIEYDGADLEIGFNVSYLVDALNAVRTDGVRIEMIDANSSCLIFGVNDDSARYVIMPMRL